MQLMRNSCGMLVYLVTRCSVCPKWMQAVLIIGVNWHATGGVPYTKWIVADRCIPMMWGFSVCLHVMLSACLELLGGVLQQQ